MLALHKDSILAGHFSTAGHNSSSNLFSVNHYFDCIIINSEANCFQQKICLPFLSNTVWGLQSPCDLFILIFNKAKCLFTRKLHKTESSQPDMDDHVYCQMRRQPPHPATIPSLVPSQALLVAFPLSLSVLQMNSMSLI